MDKELKTKWVKALRSGDFAQGDGVLYNDNRGTFCCLGVLHVCAGRSKHSIDGFTFGDVDRWLPSDVSGELAAMNDEGMPFEMIAGFINETL